MELNSLSNIMVAHHALLETMFVLFEDEAKDKSSRTAVTLSELTWEIRKHFFTEESAIFDFLPMENYGVLETINRLKDEHIEMLNDLKKFSENLPEITDQDVQKFSNLLEGHRKIEETDLYPKLDKEMREEQKKQVISRINEIPISLKKQ